MTVHWANLDTDGKIEAIKSVWQPGMSALEISANFVGATRNAVVGMYSRHGDKLTDAPLRPPKNGSVGSRIRYAKRQRRSAASKPIPTPEPKSSEPHVAGQPLGNIRPNHCRFAVNDADRGETHLFCGLPSDGMWCEFHRGLVYQPHSSLRDRAA